MSSDNSASQSEVEGDDVFQVEKILGKRIIKGVLQYRIKWLGYPASENTWEDADGCHCNDKIAAYEKSVMKAEMEQQQREAEFEPLCQLKSLYQEGKMASMLPQIYSPNVDSLATIDQLDTLDQVAKLPALQPEKVLHFDEDSRYFSVKFSHREQPLWVEFRVLQDKWPEMAQQFFEEWATLKYQKYFL